METVTEQPIKKIEFLRCPQSLPGVAPLTKKPEHSGYEIGKSTEERFVVLSIVCYVTNIPEVLLPWQVSQVFDAVFVLIKNYQRQTDSKA